MCEFDDLVAYEVADKAIPSISYCLFDRNDVLAQRHTARAGPLADDATFRIGSVSKTFAAVLAMQLVERRIVDLDVDVATYLPGFAPASPHGGGPITLRKLLSHRSGLTREAADGGYLNERAVPLARTVDELGRSTLKASSDGSAYFYSNAGFAVVGRIIEMVTGQPYAEHLQSALLEPLGLKDTSVVLTPALRARLAPAVMWTVECDSPAPIFDLGSAPAGNVVSTLSDAARWGQALLRGGEGLIRPETLEAMWTPAGPDAVRGYGYGFAVDAIEGQRSVGHGGAVYGYSTAFSLLPDAGLGVVVVSTLDFSGAIAASLGRYALQIGLASRGLAPSPKAPARRARAGTSLALSLAGNYAAESGETLRLRADGPRLMVEHRRLAYELRPAGDGSFVLDGRLRGEVAPAAAEMTIAGETLYWSQRSWRRTLGVCKPPPSRAAPYLGSYKPALMPTWLFTDGDQLILLVENLSPHECEPLADGRFLLHGPMYEREVLELCPPDADGRLSIRIGEVAVSKAR